MANTQHFTLDSYTTAVVVIPSEDIQDKVNALRKGNDKAHPRWMPHITFLFPFVAPELLESAVLHLKERIQDASLSPISVTLDHIGQFSQKGYNTVYLAPTPDSRSSLQNLWKCVSSSFGYTGRPFVPHMTLGQQKRGQPAPEALGSLATQLAGQRLPWNVESVFVLQKDSEDGGVMKVFAEIPLPGPSSSSSSPGPTATSHAPLVVDEDDQKLVEFLEQEGVIPSAEENASHQVSLDLLKHQLIGHLSSNQEPQALNSSRLSFAVEPVGTHLLGVHTPSETMDCVVIGNIPANTFWTFLNERVKQSHDFTGKQVRDVDTKQYLLSHGDSKIRVRYACSPGLLSRWSEVPDLPTDSPLLSLAPATLRVINEFRDAKALLHLVGLSRLPNFQLAHRALGAICYSRGILGKAYGYLSSESIAIVLAQAVLSQGDSPLSATSYVQAFLRTFLAHNWEGTALRLPSATGNYKPWDADAMQVLSIHKPLINYTINATLSTLDTMKRELGNVYRELDGGMPFSELCAQVDRPEAAFLSSSPHFIKMELTCWSRDNQKDHALVTEIQSALLEFLSQLRVFTSQELRLWPAIFSEAGSEKSTVKSKIFLVGISTPLEGLALEFLQGFEEKIRSMSDIYDPNKQYFSVSQVGKEDLASRDLQFVHPIEPTSDDDSDSASDSEGYSTPHGTPEREPPLPDPAWDEVSFSYSSSISKRKLKSEQKKKQQQRTRASYIAAPKLRTSVDVYNRLMWDSKSGDRADFAVGYEDRFAGLMEIGIESWKRDMDDKEFIPFHRVVHFRRKSDDQVIWDRRTKLDLVFQSGISTPTSSS